MGRSAKLRPRLLGIKRLLIEIGGIYLILADSNACKKHMYAHARPLKASWYTEKPTVCPVLFGGREGNESLAFSLNQKQILPQPDSNIKGPDCTKIPFKAKLVVGGWC